MAMSGDLTFDPATEEHSLRHDERGPARLRWRCRRGMLENDLILTRFLDARGDRLGRDRQLGAEIPLTSERSGQLESMLGHVAVAYEHQVDSRLATLTSLLGPVMIVVMYGVWNFGWTLPKIAGSNPSRLIEKKIRG